MTTNSLPLTPANGHAAGCPSDTMDAARLPGDTIASVWRCDHCEGEVPFDDISFIWCNSSAWDGRPRDLRSALRPL